MTSSAGQKLFADRRFGQAGLAATGLWLMVRSIIARNCMNSITLNMCSVFCTHDEDPYALAALLVAAELWEVVETRDNRPIVWRMTDYSVVKDTTDAVRSFSDVRDAIAMGNPNMHCDIPDNRVRGVMQIISERGIKKSDLTSFASWYSKGHYKRRGSVPTFTMLTDFDMAGLIEALAMWKSSSNSRAQPTQKQPKPQQPTKETEEMADIGSLISRIKGNHG